MTVTFLHKLGRAVVFQGVHRTGTRPQDPAGRGRVDIEFRIALQKVELARLLAVNKVVQLLCDLDLALEGAGRFFAVHGRLAVVELALRGLQIAMNRLLELLRQL